MNIVVTIKQTFDTEAKIALDGKGGIDASGVNLVINPYDEFAIEEALKLKEKFGGEVTVVSVGGDKIETSVRTALAMGCDKAVRVDDPALADADEWAVAEALAKAIAKLPYDIVLAGRIAVDDGSGQVAVRTADALGIPSVGSILKLDVDGDTATVTREIDGGTELIEVKLPAVLTAQKGLNEPRLPSMKGIMGAKKKEISVQTLADIGLSAADATPKMRAPKYSLPSPRKGGKVIPGEAADAARELARLLREEAKVI
ncbi:MAG: electron transfer flavoprotein subunit beta/FixA family protein [Clostridiales Family XIII bacterium]|jgi:electron transfer flavoprotein beta subunit|nr:electron transfer flavoprotein subunit beta/FixA family protein [Clostridiales Family XIII bacterium]